MFKKGDIVKYKKVNHFCEIQISKNDYLRCNKFQILIENDSEYTGGFLLYDDYKITNKHDYITLSKNDIELDKVYYRRKKIEKCLERVIK